MKKHNKIILIGILTIISVWIAIAEMDNLLDGGLHDTSIRSDGSDIFSIIESKNTGGGSIDMDPDLSPTYALDFMGGLFYPNIISIASLFAAISALFLVPHFILKRKNILSRPYMALILSGILLHYGITNLIPFGNQISIILHLLDKESSFFIQQVFPQFLIPVIALAIAGILLYRSSILRKLMNK